MVREGPGTSVVVHVASLKKETLRDARFAIVIYELNKMASFPLRHSIFRGEYMTGGTLATTSARDHLVASVSVRSRVIQQVSIYQWSCVSLQ